MALLTCPECSHGVSDSAAACPYCGYLLTPEMSSALKRREQQVNKMKQIGCLVVIAILFIIWFVLYGSYKMGAWR